MIKTYETHTTEFVAVCASCGAEGPGAINPHDAHQMVIDDGWKSKTIYPDGEAVDVYKCPDCQLVYFDKSKRAEAKEFLIDHNARMVSGSNSDTFTYTLYEFNNGDMWEENESRLEEPEFYYTLAKVVTKGKED